MSVFELFRKGADACAKVNVKSGTAYISVNDISAIVECGDEVEIHMNSGTIFTMTEPPEKSHSRSTTLTRIEDVLHEAFSDEAKHVGAEYLNMIAEIAGVISR